MRSRSDDSVPAVAAVALLPFLGMPIAGIMIMSWMGGAGLLVLLPVVAGIALLVLGVADPQHLEDPLETVKRRVAAGKITEEQYEEVREVLGIRAERRAAGGRVT